MAALSDYLESGILTHLFLNGTFEKPSIISVALTSGVPKENQDGSSIPELPSGFGYSRVDLGDPATEDKWEDIGVDSITTFQVYQEKENPEISGYFYPLYLNENTARSANNNVNPTERSFEDYPGVSFYSPDSIYQSGQPTDPGSGYVTYQGNGFIKNKNQILFSTALNDWGWVSGVAILDSSDYGSGNLLMFSQLSNPRYIYTGDNIKFDSNSLEISIR